MLFSIIRAMVLVVSLWGYFTVLKKKDVPTPFIPVMLLTAIGSFLFAAGILNLLPLATVAVFLGGLWYVKKEKAWKIRANFSRQDLTAIGVFFLICLLFGLRLYGERPTHYDAFSHWLTVIRETLQKDRFPNFDSELIYHQGYPTGAAAFAYFICKITGCEAESLILFTHAVIIAASLCALLVFMKSTRLPGLAIFLLGSLYCLVASPVTLTALCEPLPDTLISILSIAALAMVVHFRKDLSRAAWFSLPLQVYLMAVKNSGLFMILFNTGLLLFYLYQQIPNDRIAFRKQALKLAGIHCGIPFLIFFLWNRRVAQVYRNGTLSKHTVSLSYYRGVLGAKSISEIFEVIGNFLKRFFSWGDSWLMLVICVIVFGLIFLIRRKASGEKPVDVLHSFCGIVIAYTLFMVGLAGMYLMSMEPPESTMLSGYARYEKIVITYLVGAIMIFLLQMISAVPAGKYRAGVSALSVLAMAVILSTQMSRIPNLILPIHKYEGSTRQLVEQLKDEYDIPTGAHCAIYGSKVSGDSGYHTYMGRFVFDNKTVNAFSPKEGLPDPETLRSTYDYLILMDSDSAVEAYLTENGFTPGSSVYRLNAQ